MSLITVDFLKNQLDSLSEKVRAESNKLHAQQSIISEIKGAIKMVNHLISCFDQKEQEDNSIEKEQYKEE